MEEPSPHSSSKAVDKSPNDYDNVLTKSFFFLCCLCWNNYGAILTVMCFLNSPSSATAQLNLFPRDFQRIFAHIFSIESLKSSETGISSVKQLFV